MRKVIVTGANGFVGSALCRNLSQKGVLIIALVRSVDSDVSCLMGLNNLSIVYCDMNDYKNLDSLISDTNIDAVYHFAWCGSAGSLRGDAEIQLRNISDSINLLYFCKRINCNRFVFAASVMEYEVDKAIKSNLKININSLYSVSKLACDYMLRTIADSLDIDFIRCVISNIYGPGENGPRLVNSSIRKMLKGEHCAFSKGDQLYDFIYIDDAVEAIVAVEEKGERGKIYYIGNINPKPLREFLLEMKDCVNPEIEIGLGEIPFNGVSLTYKEFNTREVKNDTGVEPKISFDQGIKNTIKWMRDIDE